MELLTKIEWFIHSEPREESVDSRDRKKKSRRIQITSVRSKYENYTKR
jgi:hypothetical protein